MSKSYRLARIYGRGARAHRISERIREVRAKKDQDRAMRAHRAYRKLKQLAPDSPRRGYQSIMARFRDQREPSLTNEPIILVNPDGTEKTPYQLYYERIIQRLYEQAYLQNESIRSSAFSPLAALSRNRSGNENNRPNGSSSDDNEIDYETYYTRSRILLRDFEPKDFDTPYSLVLKIYRLANSLIMEIKRFFIQGTLPSDEFKFEFVVRALHAGNRLPNSYNAYITMARGADIWTRAPTIRDRDKITDEDLGSHDRLARRLEELREEIEIEANLGPLNVKTLVYALRVGGIITKDFEEYLAVAIEVDGETYRNSTLIAYAHLLRTRLHRRAITRRDLDILVPRPKDLTSAEEKMANFLRELFIEMYDGKFRRVKNVHASTVRKWLSGKFSLMAPSRASFIWEMHIKKIIDKLVPKKDIDKFIVLLNRITPKGYPEFSREMIEMDDKEIIILRLQQLARILGHTPSPEEVNAQKGYAKSQTIARKFGTFNDALRAAGLSIPVTRVDGTPKIVSRKGGITREELDRILHLPPDLTPAERKFADLVRDGFIQRHNGQYNRTGYTSATVKRWLSGQWLTIKAKRGGDIWEVTFARSIKALLPKRKRNKAIELVNQIKPENYPPFERRMLDMETEDIMLLRVVDFHNEHERFPRIGEIADFPGWAHHSSYIRIIGPWKKVLEIARSRM